MHLKTTFIGAPSEHVFQSELNLAMKAMPFVDVNFSWKVLP